VAAFRPQQAREVNAGLRWQSHIMISVPHQDAHAIRQLFKHNKTRTMHCAQHALRTDLGRTTTHRPQKITTCINRSSGEGVLAVPPNNTCVRLFV
jgi:hypothetical protein